MDNCKCCGSENVEHVTRVTGFFSKVEGWNKGKIGELRDRRARDGGHFAS
ncbi:MAG: anaerobic ribonucleoside-triphosphate reductase [Candidatus Hydrothermarchaeaceae archaeon]